MMILTSETSFCRSPDKSIRVVSRLFGLVLMLHPLLPVVAQAQETGSMIAEGFAEPRQTVDVASPESGTIQEVLVRQGQKVRKGDVLVQMDPDSLLPALELARAKSEARSKLEAAKIELAVKQRRVENLSRLGKENSSSEEMIRATADVDLARTSVLAAEEEIRQSQLEAKRIEVQLERRTIRSPITGVVLRLHHEPGEFVTITEPTLVTVADLSQLRIVLHPLSTDAGSLEENDKVRVQLERHKELAEAVVDFVSPVTNADSGTVRVELLIGNENGQFRSGQRCWLSCGNRDDSPTAPPFRLGSSFDSPIRHEPPRR